VLTRPRRFSNHDRGSPDGADPSTVVDAGCSKTDPELGNLVASYLSFSSLDPEHEQNCRSSC